MHHLAIMKQQLGFVDKILSGQKTIESRWYRQRRAPWDHVHNGDVIYFKETNRLVTARAVISAVKQYDDLSAERVRDLVGQYGAHIGIAAHQQLEFIRQWSQARYGVLMWLKDVEPVAPFAINKKGYGAMSAWLCFESVNPDGTLRRPT